MSKAYISTALRAQVLGDAGGRCGYCRTSEEITGAELEMDHLVPEALGGPTTRENLWAACRQCNGAKSGRIEGIDPETGVTAPLFNPRRQRWSDHFAWADEGALIVGRTPTGRATVATIDLNRLALVRARRRWIAVGWHPPAE